MNPDIQRREFLKLAASLSLGLFVPPSRLNTAPAGQNSARKNVLILVYDAFSGNNTPLYGYGRDTTPNITRLAQRAIVYHNHFSAGNYTTPGTASLLTGAYPWTHRAFNMNDTVDKPFSTKNIFNAFPDYYRMAYTHNPLANILIKQFAQAIEGYIPMDEYFLLSGASLDAILKSDEDIANVSWQLAFEKSQRDYTYSLYLSHLVEAVKERFQKKKLAGYQSSFPRGVPDVRGSYFTLEQATEGLWDLLLRANQPYLGYFHFYPPHAPYATRQDFFKKFAKDGFQPLDKPEHVFSENRSTASMNNKRMEYDEYLLYVDEEFGRLYDFIDQNGLLENTWLVLTSDHGEMFERGIFGHTTPAMSKPLLHVPLLIFEPGRTERLDVRSITNSVDLLPTLAQVSGQSIPDWCEGEVLPPFGLEAALQPRSSFSMDVRGNAKRGPLKKGSVVLLQEPYKFAYYYGYKQLESHGGEFYELFDIMDDPEEMNDLAPANPALASSFLEQIKNKIK